MELFSYYVFLSIFSSTFVVFLKNSLQNPIHSSAKYDSAMHPSGPAGFLSFFEDFYVPETKVSIDLLAKVSIVKILKSYI